ncbi:Raffinose synthase family protein [Perilla frutescens var. hirtella]|uniref:galactinol--sucrose galactosyltransferase n=1 Tax=Perilla frutescens var. hirtella TaxID=608512 RepID=A0AAD4JB33_PERFH|nr:Raffinose synthase family protein [Perilla frutescens var. hirtella]KAH6830519.1 Raffinose synthase family protein [Perilla frutescens var. hirtella]
MAPSLSKGGSNAAVIVDGFTDSLITLDESNFIVNDHVILSDVPLNITAAPSPYAVGDKAAAVPATVSPGCFVGFDANKPDSHHVVPIGKLKNIKFMSIFRFKVWWTTHWIGSNGSDLERETQIVVLDKSDGPGDSKRPYVVLLPLIDGQFRASLQPGIDDFIDICVESGSTKVVESSFRASLYMHAGDDPFTLVKDAIKVARHHLGTFRLLEEKTPPGIVDKFGWCTWDAFYLTVQPQGVMEGVKGLVDGGCPPGLVLIDDGWQSICHDEDSLTTEGTTRTSAGEQMPCRLIKFEENFKFRDYKSPNQTGPGPKTGMGAFVRDMKDTYKSVDYVYVWHALCGYWGGLRPGVPGLPDVKVIEPKLTPGLKTTMEDLAVDKIVNNGVGLVPPKLAEQMYEGMHSHLESVGIDGVKVDVIHLLEMLSEDYGGRVELAKDYYKALTNSVRNHFKGNGVIASMEHCNDFMFLGTEAITLGRVGDDFWCTDPSGDPNGTFWLQGCHMVHCAYNSLWMGNFIHPDWDMFQSTHPCAEFHAASRAISGGPIYVSDSVGKHNFKLLKSLVLPDGSLLRCDYYALPTLDCLFENPLHNGETMLKIWNLNKFTGVIGAFNCQGGGWSREERRNKCYSEYSRAVSSTTGPSDVEWKQGPNPIAVDGVQTFALYLFKEKKLVLIKPSGTIDVELEPFEFELITVSPVKVLARSTVQFAPIGLVNMLNTGGAIQSVAYNDRAKSVRIGVKGTGEMKVFASERPAACKVNGESVRFGYEGSMVAVEVPWTEPSGVAVVEYLF